MLLDATTSTGGTSVVGAGAGSSFVTPLNMRNVDVANAVRLGPYQLLHNIGKGNFAVVKLAYHVELKTKVHFKHGISFVFVNWFQLYGLRQMTQKLPIENKTRVFRLCQE